MHAVRNLISTESSAVRGPVIPSRLLQRFLAKAHTDQLRTLLQKKIAAPRTCNLIDGSFCRGDNFAINVCCVALLR